MREILFRFLKDEYTGHSSIELLEELEIKNYTLCMDIIENFKEYESILKFYIDENITQDRLEDDFKHLQELKRHKMEEILEEEQKCKEERLCASKEARERIVEKQKCKEENYRHLTKSCVDFGGNGYHGYGNRYKPKKF